MRIEGKKYYKEKLEEIKKLFHKQNVEENKNIYYTISENNDNTLVIKELLVTRENIINFLNDNIVLFTDLSIPHFCKK